MKACAMLLLLTLSFIGNTALAQRKIIFKLDDFSARNGSCPAAPVLDYLVQMKIKAGIGFIAKRLDATAYGVLRTYLDATDNAGQKLFEVWHHGLDHVKPEFRGTDYAYQKNHFDSGTLLIKNLLNVQMRSFGSPYNANDSITNNVIAEDPNYKVTLFNKPAPAAATGILNLNNRVNMEISTGIVDFNAFVSNYNTYKNTYSNLMVLQGHPHLWTPALLDQFKLIIDFLIKEGCIFVTPYEYYLSVNAAAAGIADKEQTIVFNKPVKQITLQASALSHQHVPGYGL